MTFYLVIEVKRFTSYLLNDKLTPVNFVHTVKRQTPDAQNLEKRRNPDSDNFCHMKSGFCHWDALYRIAPVWIS